MSDPSPYASKEPSWLVIFDTSHNVLQLTAKRLSILVCDILSRCLTPSRALYIKVANSNAMEKRFSNAKLQRMPTFQGPELDSHMRAFRVYPYNLVLSARKTLSITRVGSESSKGVAPRVLPLYAAKHVRPPRRVSDCELLVSRSICSRGETKWAGARRGKSEL